MSEEKKKCIECEQADAVTKDGLCFGCLAKKHEEPGDNEGSWMNRG